MGTATVHDGSGQAKRVAGSGSWPISVLQRLKGGGSGMCVVGAFGIGADNAPELHEQTAVPGDTLCDPSVTGVASIRSAAPPRGMSGSAPAHRRPPQTSAPPGRQRRASSSAAVRSHPGGRWRAACAQSLQIHSQARRAPSIVPSRSPPGSNGRQSVRGCAPRKCVASSPCLQAEAAQDAPEAHLDIVKLSIPVIRRCRHNCFMVVSPCCYGAGHS